MGIKQDALGGRPLKIQIIDAHTHISENYHRGLFQKDASNTSIVNEMDRLGIDCIVTAPHPIVDGMMSFSNELAEQAIAEYPGRIYGYITICPHDGADVVMREIDKYCSRPGFLGLKLLAGYHGELTRSEYQPALSFAAKVHCPVLVHKWNNEPSVKGIIEVVEKYPALKLIIAHLGGGSQKYTEEYTALMRQYPNLYIELCGSLFNTIRLDEVVKFTDENRIIFGTDLIYLDPRYALAYVALANLDDSVKMKIFSQNYLNLLEDSQMGKIKIPNYMLQENIFE